MSESTNFRAASNRAPAASRPGRSFARLRATLAALLGALTLAYVAGTAWSIWIAHERALADAARRTSSLARAFEEHAARVVGAVDLLMLDIADGRLGDAASARKDADNVGSVMRRGLAFLPQVRRMVVLDRSGDVIATATPDEPSVGAATRAFFTAHRNDPNLGLFLDAPGMSEADGRHYVALSRRIAGANGRFEGVVAAGLDPRYFSEFYEAIDLGKGGVVNVLTDDGAVIARVPAGEDVYARPGADFAGLADALRRARVGTIGVVSAIDGVERILSYRCVEMPGIVVAVGISRREALAAWRRDSWYYGGTAAGVVAVAAALALSLLRNVARLEEADRNLRRVEAERRSIFENAVEGIYRSSLDGKWLMANPAFVRMHGYDTEAEFLAAVNDIATEYYVDPTMRSHIGRILEEKGKLIGHESEVYRHRTREKFWARENSLVVRDEGGKIVGYEGTVLDIAAHKRAEEARRESERRLHALADTIPGAVYRSYAERPFVCAHLSEGALELTGYPAEDFVDDRVRSFVSIVHPEDWPRIQRETADKDRYAIEYRILHKDRSIRWVQDSCRLVAAGGRAYLDGVLLDITDRRHKEAALAEATRNLRVTFENMGEGISLVGPDMRLVSWNRRFLEILDIPEALMRPGIPFADLVRFNAERGEYGPGSVEEQMRARMELARRLEPHRFERTRPDGTVIEVRGHPLPGGGFVATYIDVTEGKRAEAARIAAVARERAAQARLVDAIESSSEGFVLYDRDERFIICNDRYRELYPDTADLHVPGTPYEAILRTAVARGQFVLPEGTDSEALIRQRLESFRNPGPPDIRHLASGRWVLISERRTAEGGIVSVRTDVTALKQNEQALTEAKELAEAASRAKTDFLAGMSHELRTPLHAILGLAEVIRDQADDRQAIVHRYAQAIHDSGKHLLDLIGEILDMSAIEAGGRELGDDVVDVRETVASCLALVSARAAKQGVVLESAVPQDMPFVRGDRRALKQVLINLLSNAIKFTLAGGTIALRAALEPGGGALLAVTDTGIGIAAADLPRVTEAFWQVERGSTRKYEGVGLGLAICRRIVEMHGGRLAIESEIGRGTTVTVHLPTSRVLLG